MGRRADVSLIFYPIIMILVYVLFRHPLFRNYLMPYLPSVEIAFASLFVSSLVKATTKSGSLATLIKGLGIAVAVYALPLVNIGIDYRPPMALVVIGVTLSAISSDLPDTQAFTLRGVGIAVLLYGVYLVSSQLSKVGMLAKPFLYVSVGVLASYILAAFESAGVLSGRFFIKNLNVIVVVFAFYGLYYALRPYVQNSYPKLVFYFDWLILASTVLLAALAVQNYLTSRNLENYLVGEWKRHEFKLSFLGDTELERAKSSIENFVLRARKTPLVIYLIHYGRILGEDRIKRICEPIIEYSKPCLSSFTPGWYLKRVERRELEKRVNLVKRALEEIEKALEGGR
ncbi:hypothetical protein [Thermococcus sp.]